MAPKSRKRVYLDVCALCRPFDDQRQLRIQIETDALYLILEHVKSADYDLIVSPAHFVEIGATTHEKEDAQVMAFLNAYGTKPSWDMAKVRMRAEELHRLRFGAADAAHVAFAEDVADVLVTCDEALLRKCRNTDLRICAMNLIEFLIAEGLR